MFGGSVQRLKDFTQFEFLGKELVESKIQRPNPVFAAFSVQKRNELRRERGFLEVKVCISKSAQALDKLCAFKKSVDSFVLALKLLVAFNDNIYECVEDLQS